MAKSDRDGKKIKLVQQGTADRANLITARAAILFAVKVADIRSPGRGTKVLVTARHLVAHALRVEIGWTLQEVAKFLARSGHDVVITSVKNAEKLLEEQPTVAAAYAQMIAA